MQRYGEPEQPAIVVRSSTVQPRSVDRQPTTFPGEHMEGSCIARAKVNPRDEGCGESRFVRADPTPGKILRAIMFSSTCSVQTRTTRGDVSPARQLPGTSLPRGASSAVMRLMTPGSCPTMCHVTQEPTNPTGVASNSLNSLVMSIIPG